MATKTVPLSKANIRKLRDNFRAAAKGMHDVAVDIEKIAGERVAEALRFRIASIPDVDGNYLGSDNPNASVRVEAGLISQSIPTKVTWHGKQVAFLEFGTGATGAGRGTWGGGAAYPRPEAMAAAGYHPDPTKQGWWYKDERYNMYMESFGIPPYAPVAQTAVDARRRKVLRNVAVKQMRQVREDALAL